MRGFSVEALWMGCGGGGGGGEGRVKSTEIVTSEQLTSSSQTQLKPAAAFDFFSPLSIF